MILIVASNSDERRRICSPFQLINFFFHFDLFDFIFELFIQITKIFKKILKIIYILDKFLNYFTFLKKKIVKALMPNQLATFI